MSSKNWWYRPAPTPTFDRGYLDAAFGVEHGHRRETLARLAVRKRDRAARAAQKRYARVVLNTSRFAE